LSENEPSLLLARPTYVTPDIFKALRQQLPQSGH